MENYILFLGRKPKYHTDANFLYMYKFKVITMKITGLFFRTKQGDSKVYLEN